MRTSERGYVGVWAVVFVLAVTNMVATAHATRLGWTDVIVALACLMVAVIAVLMIQDVVRRS